MKSQDALAKLRKAKRDMDAKIREAERLAGLDPYARHREDMRQRRAAMTHQGQDIAPIPECVNPKRRAAAAGSFRLFCESYFAKACFRPWSQDLLRVLDKMESTARNAGLLAFAMPRSTGKTTLTKLLAIWAVLNGYHKFVMMIAANEEAALKRLIGGVKRELRFNDLLLDDYPEAIYPIRCLQGKAARAKGQHVSGVPTNIEWAANTVVMPTVPGSLCSEAVLTSTGLTASDIRGQQYTCTDGSVIRPSLVILDDPQTRDSARSLGQTEERMRIIVGDIMGMADPSHPIAVFCPCTVIYRGDLADQLLDREQNPAWKGERTKLVYNWPCEEGRRKWLEYREILAADMRANGDGAAATDFYAANREVMDRDSEVAWPEFKRDDELSALQSAYNIRFRCKGGDEAFFAEYQNEPVENNTKAVLTAALVANKLNRLRRGTVPKECQYLSAYIDVHLNILYWVVSAWKQDFGGGPADYGTYPQQPISYFSQDNPPIKMSDVHRGMTEDAWILASLETLVTQLLTRTFMREDGFAMRIGKLLIDAKWGEKNKLVKSFVRRHPQANTIVFAAQGLGIGASSKPFYEYRPEAGAQMGLNWRIPPAQAGDRWVTIDTNWWKSFMAARLFMPVGTPGGWELFGDDPATHQLFADHCVAEEPIEVTAKGRTVDEWKWKPGRPDNHWLDCLVGSAVAGSMLGAAPEGMEKPKPAPRPQPQPQTQESFFAHQGDGRAFLATYR
jgi:hypothetical protein